MKRGLVLLVLAVFTISSLQARGESEGPGLLDTIVGSGKIINKELSFRDFTAVSVSSGMRLSVREGSIYRVVLRTDDNAVSRIKTEKQGDTLRFYFDHGIRFRNVTVEIEIQLPVLSGIEAAGGSRVTVQTDTNADNFKAFLSGGSRIEGSLNADTIALDFSGGSTATLGGTGKSLTVMGSGGSTFNLANFSTNAASFDLSGGSRAEISVYGTIAVNASGGSRVLFSGGATVIRQSLSGGSRIDRK